MDWNNPIITIIAILVIGGVVAAIGIPIKRAIQKRSQDKRK